MHDKTSPQTVRLAKRAQSPRAHGRFRRRCGDLPGRPQFPTLVAVSLAVSLTTLALPGLARAEDQDPVAVQRGPTEGVERPIKDIAGSGDASSLELNPALIAAARGVDLVMRGYGTTDRFTQGSGFGAWLSTNFGFGFATAIGLQTIAPAFTDQRLASVTQLRQPPLTKLSLGIATGDAKRVATGFSMHFAHAAGRWLGKPDLDFGLVARITNYASIGASIRWAPGGRGATLPLDLLAPTQSTLPAEVRIRSELAIRPLGNRTLELAGGVGTRALAADDEGLSRAFSQLGAADIFGHGRVGVRVFGLGVHAQVEQVPVAILDASTLQISRTGSALRGGLAIDLAWDMVSAGTGVHLGINGANDPGVDGVSGMARFTTRRQGRVIPVRRVDAERIRLGLISDQRDLIEALETIERAERSGGRAILVLDTAGVSLGYASALELREALIRARNAGVHIYAWIEAGDTKEYYLASVAERVLIHPAGELRLLGVKATSFYFADALAKLSIKAESLHAGEYKSASETFTRNSRSPEDKLQEDAILDDTFDQIVGDIAQARGKETAEVRTLVNEGLFGPDRALEAGLVDEIAFRDELLPKISDHLGVDVGWGSFPKIEPVDKTWSDEQYIAVLLVEGTIVDGPGARIPFVGINLVGGDTMAKELRRLRDDRACKGIILRIDSPGGSAFASDVIWREVQRTHDAHLKDPRSPEVIVSMSDVAASGGYYIAAGTTRIFAEPTTITGSIGVLSLHFDVSGLLRRLGIATDTLERGDKADLDSIFHPYDEGEREALQGSIDRTYELFLSRVAQARGKSRDEIDAVARGHVYSGRDALDVGLVDELGGLKEAIAALREEMKIPARKKIALKVLPRPARLLDLILGAFDPSLTEPALKARARRQARKALPPTVDRALARIPLSVLYLHDGAPATLMARQLEIE